MIFGQSLQDYEQNHKTIG